MKGEMCSHIVQVALVTGRMGVPGKSEGTVVLKDVIAAEDAAIQALEGG